MGDSFLPHRHVVQMTLRDRLDKRIKRGGLRDIECAGLSHPAVPSVMLKEDFIKIYLLNNGVPLVTPTGKDTVISILKGYRAAGWSAQGFSKFTKKYFPNKKRGLPILTYILLNTKTNNCTLCNQILGRENFSSNKSTKTGLNNLCKPCNSVYRRENVDTTYYNSKRRAEIVKAIPPWADLNKIKLMYKNCPKGYHVDHIYPLNNSNLCGLHVENNLQYLPAADNMKKGNKVP